MASHAEEFPEFYFSVTKFQMDWIYEIMEGLLGQAFSFNCSQLYIRVNNIV